jgi:hypothetical protein
MIGTMPLSQVIGEMIPWHTFNLLVLAVKYFLQISQVNSVMVDWNQFVRLVNECCRVNDSKLK